MINSEPAATTDYVEQDGGQPNSNRRSQVFFNICDMRTATVIVNILNIVFTVIVTLIMAFMSAFEYGPYKIQHTLRTILGGVLVSLISFVALYSAMNWREDGMMASTAAYGLVLLVRLIKFEWIDVLVTALILYPHVIFTMEMRNGIMTPDTFENEEYVTETGRDFVEMAHTYCQ
eukprot:jgi/Psemu1/23950/gm1.23950_g